ncbi:hypothetical protein DFH07DRAFT_951757 [Mycena maculata]|uniref:Uncharacterized protein n=1 Tax=Mycena maculata TaxID=230809 RepID=A0AAD7K6I1_9AGAR|nr:hypothetical protein DFH07DRAFT_951757 [Mycena maculata]
MELDRTGRAICRIMYPYIGSYTKIGLIFGVSRQRVSKAVRNGYAPPDDVSRDYDYAGSDFMTEYPPIEDPNEDSGDNDEIEYPYQPSGSVELEYTPHTKQYRSEESSHADTGSEADDLHANHTPNVVHGIPVATPYIELPLRRQALPHGAMSRAFGSNKRPRSLESNGGPSRLKRSRTHDSATQPIQSERPAKVIHKITFIERSPVGTQLNASEMGPRTPISEDPTRRGLYSVSRYRKTNEGGRYPSQREPAPKVVDKIIYIERSSRIKAEPFDAQESETRPRLNEVSQARIKKVEKPELPVLLTVKTKPGLTYVSSIDANTEGIQICNSHKVKRQKTPDPNDVLNQRKQARTKGPQMPDVPTQNLPHPIFTESQDMSDVEPPPDPDAAALKIFLSNIGGFDLSSRQEMLHKKGLRTMQDLLIIAHLEESHLLKTLMRLLSSEDISELQIILCGVHSHQINEDRVSFGILPQVAQTLRIIIHHIVMSPPASTRDSSEWSSRSYGSLGAGGSRRSLPSRLDPGFLKSKMKGSALGSLAEDDESGSSPEKPSPPRSVV